MNTLATLNNRNRSSELQRGWPSFPPLGSSFFGDIFGEMIPNSFPSNMMSKNVLEDGSTVLEYNLAGYKPEQIMVKMDTAQSQLIIKAKNDDDNRRQVFNTVISLSPYTSPEDVKTSYEHGVLAITIAPLEKRKEEALVDIPVT
jgi:HSP20 family molecular chaperone IbpA